MPMTNDEKRCLAVAKNFLDEARQQTGFVAGQGLRDSVLHAQGTMLGEIAAQKFAICMSEHTPPIKQKVR